MNNAILHLVVLSVVSGAVISIIPEGGVKSITTILSTLILISSIIGSIGKPDMQEYALKAADVDNIEQEFKLNTVENAAALKHIYFENQCIEYILDKAKECNIIVHEVDIEITENKDFVPQPFSVSCRSPSSFLLVVSLISLWGFTPPESPIRRQFLRSSQKKTSTIACCQIQQRLYHIFHYILSYFKYQVSYYTQFKIRVDFCRMNKGLT